MYQAKESKVAFDPYEYIPSYGETSIKTDFKDNVLELSIIFDKEETNQEGTLKIIFKNAFFYKSESYPGVRSMEIEYDYGDSLSSLITFSKSDFASAWEKNFNGLFKLSHYKIFFLNANKSVEVICESFQIEPPLK